MKHFVAKGPQPLELLELRLCRDVFHCPPDVLDRQDPLRILAYLTVLDVEADYQNMQTPPMANTA